MRIFKIGLILLIFICTGCSGPRGYGVPYVGEKLSAVCIVRNDRVREKTFVHELVKALKKRKISPVVVDDISYCDQDITLKYSGRHSFSSGDRDMSEIDLELIINGKLIAYNYWDYKKGEFDTIDLKGGSVFSYLWHLEEALDGLFGLREVRH